MGGEGGGENNQEWNKKKEKCELLTVFMYRDRLPRSRAKE